jgi:chromate reductase, NAD(P)H dehydrogenase (quinone)
VVRVLAISGSLRRSSHNTNLLSCAAAERMGPKGVEIDLFDGLGAIPPYDEDADGLEAPAPVAELRECIAAADAVLFATPEYNGSIPGQLKNALDWASRPFATNALRNKPVAVVGASTGMFGAVWAQAELRRVLGLIGARVVDVELPVGQAPLAFDEVGRISDDELRTKLAGVVDRLAEAAELRGVTAAA